MRSCRSSILILLTLGLCMALPSARGGDEGASSAADAAGTFADQGEDGRRVYHTHRTTDPPEIDGRLDDAVWELVPWSGEFVQRSPDEGDAPTGQTRFKILYDDANIYVAYRAYDPEPARIGNVLDRRDYFPGDWVEINIDSYHDLRTAFSFTASVSGTQGDEFVSDDGDRWDGNWDPIWEHKTQIDGEGWTAEARIPLSQLRYADREEHTWGIQVTRRIYRCEERSVWQPIPRDEDGWVSKFGELRGIRGLCPQRQIELMPYAVTKAERFEESPGDPFNDGSRETFSGGLDGKIGLASDLTLDFTANPDFGQVEADPSVVNLTEFETFFSERRPFFIEGSSIFNFRVAPSITGGTHTTDRLFYSRRIGRQPHYRADWYEAGFVDQPDNTTILGAAKLSGKTAGGVSIGILESVTGEERAEIELDGQRHDVTVEPLTNYFVGRMQRDYREGRTTLGGILTAVHRKIDDSQLENLHDAAYSGGLDLFHYLSGRRYYMTLKLVGSHVRGSEEAILSTQTAPARYYQRPGNAGQSVDSTLTSLSGQGGSLMFGKSEGNLRFQGGAAWRSAGFELNDIGYVRNCDEINEFLWAGYSIRKPFSIFRHAEFNVNEWLDYEYDSGTSLYQAFNQNASLSFRNNWSAYWSITRQNERTSNHELRGGPAMKIPGDWSFNLNLNSDGTKPLSFNLGTWQGVDDDDAGWGNSYWGTIGWRPTNALRIRFNPSYSRGRGELQYVTTANGEATRYVFGRIQQETFDLTFRIDWALTPTLTVQYYGAPFVCAGDYSEFKRVSDPLADACEDRFVPLDEVIAYDEGNATYAVDEDGDGTTDYSFGNPDFNVRDFNSNLVVRWEYSPGSSLYLVWQQARSGYDPTGEFALRDDLDGLFEVHPHNIFLIKASRWFNL